MTPEKATKLAREIFSDEHARKAGATWFLFENGTLVVGRALGEDTVLGTMEQLATALGPYEGQGSTYGDVDPMPLKNHAKTWLVGYPFNGGMFTFVDEDDFVDANKPPQDEFIQAAAGTVRAAEALGALRVGLCARAKRNRDARGPKIIARWSDA